jgi:hypothetical protein
MTTVFLLALLISAKIADKKDSDNADAEDEVSEPAAVPSGLGMAGVRTVLAARAKPRTKANIRLPWPLLG